MDEFASMGLLAVIVGVLGFVILYRSWYRS
jgi:hypothetical protein